MENAQEVLLKVGYLMQNGAPDLVQVSGPQLHTVAVIKGLQKLGHRVRIIATQNYQLKWTDDLETWHLPRFGMSTHTFFRLLESALRRIQSELNLPYLGFFDSLHYADAFCKQLKGFHILYERHGYMGFAGVIASRLLKIPLVLELNGNILKEIDERGLDISPLQRKVGQWITIQTCRAANRIIAVSEALKRTLITAYNIPADKITVVVNGANLELFSKEYDVRPLQDRYRLCDGPKIVFVGSFEPWHGVDLLLSSYSEVLQTNPNCQLILVGHGSGYKKAVRQAADLGLDGKVKFLGRLSQDQAAAIVSLAKVVVAPYPFETGDIVGTPLKLLEYMAAGKGIVASSAPIHEIIEDGFTGIRVAPANVQALAEGIVRLLVDDKLCSTLGRNAALKAQKYSWDQVNRELSKILLDEVRNYHGHS